MVWFIAIPILDCVGLIFSRIKKKIPISSPGRDHIHHKLMKKFSSEQTLGIILVISTLTGLFGVYLNNNFSALVSTLLFLLYAIIYYTFNNYYSIILNKLRIYV
jgi:UDP-GlcNAc:undecaprenyl-phosphate GlcNAc-1-phosphate transferase